MSSFDINKVVSWLQSTKIKDRNDGLSLVEDLLNSKFKLNPKQFDVLVVSMFKLIENEQISYSKNRTTSTELRLSSGSNCLKLLIERSLDYNQELRDSNKPIKIKYKFYMSVIHSIRNYYFIEDDILEPCALDFTKILSCITSQGFFKEHLNYEDWLQIYNLIIKLSNFVLDDLTKLNIHEKLIIEIFTSLHFLIQADSSISVNYLQLTTSTVPNNYFKLLRVLSKTCIYFKKESILTVLIFKVINKMIIVLCTENIKFINKLIQISIKLMISFHQTQLDSLQIQFLIFLNLSATHNFLNLHNLPKLIGDSSIILDDPSDSRQDISIRSSEDSSTINQSIDSITDSDSDEVTLYNVGVLIQNLATKLYSSNNQINSEDICFLRIPNDDKVWFKFRSIYLRASAYDESNSVQSWLFIAGLSKLINSYFEFKKSLYEHNIFNSINTLNASGVRSETIHQNKRQKLGVLSEALYHSNNILEFCNRLLIDKTDYKLQQAGMQILTFHLEIYSPKVDIKSLNSKTNNNNIRLSGNSSTKSSSILDISDSTFLNSTFDFPLLTNDSESLFNVNIILKNVLNSFDTDELNYWSLMVARAIIYDSLQRLIHIDKKFFFQLLKIALQLIKNKEVSRVSCSLAYSIISCHSNEDLNKIMDKSLILQIDNLIDLSEINGPFSICEESFQLWYSINKIVRNINLSRNFILAERIQDWLICKWDLTSNINTGFWYSSINSTFEVVNFVCWLGGIDIEENDQQNMLNSYRGDLNEADLFMNSYNELEMFLLDNYKLRESNMSLRTEIKFYNLSENKTFDYLLSRIIETGKSYLKDERNHAEALEWAMLELRTLDLLRDHGIPNQLINSIQNQASLLFEVAFLKNASSNANFIGVLSRINFKSMKRSSIELIANCIELDNFFYEISNNGLIGTNQKLMEEDRLDNNTDMFRDEFNTTNETTNSFRIQSKSTTLNFFNLAYGEVYCVQALKCILIRNEIKENSTFETFGFIVTYLESLRPQEVLYCLCYLCRILENGEIKSSEIPITAWTRFVRILGEGPLTNFDLERDELTIIVVSKLLTLLFPIWYDSSDDAFKKDCLDMCSWLLQCGTKNLILTEASSIEFLIFIITYLQYNDQRIMEDNEIKSLFISKFTKSTNNIKIKILPCLVNYLKSISVPNQMTIYKELFLNFDTPQQSIEACGTFCLFFCILSDASIQVTIAVIFNFIEYSRFEFFLPYIKAALSLIYKRLDLKSTKDLFNLLKYEILKSWWSYGFDIMQFPYGLFDYDNIPSFLSSNYKELTAISISTQTNSNNNNFGFLETISSVKNSDLASLIFDSLTLAIPLAYTREGIRNDIFKKLSDILKEQYRLQMKEKLVSIIFEVIRLTDMSNEKYIRDLGPKNEVILQLFKSDSQTLETPGLVSISLHSSFDLIKGLVEKYSVNPKSFWQGNVLYFLFRHISIIFHNSVNIEQRLLCLRKFKLLIILGYQNIFLVHLANLLITTLSPFLKESNLHDDIANILSIFRIQKLSRCDESKFLPIIVKLVSCLIEVGDSIPFTNVHLLKTVEEYISCSNKDRKVHIILEASMNILNSEPVELTTSDIEFFLNDEAEIKLCTTGVSNVHIMKLISLIFMFIERFDETGVHENVVKLLLNQNDDMHWHSKTFRLWSAEYLAKYYLKGGLNNNISHIVSLVENGTPIEDTFESDISSMNNILNEILLYVVSDNLEIAACAESILSVLIWKFKIKRSDVEKFLNFDKIENEYVLFIVPLDFHSCIILNSNDDELLILGHTFKEIISDLGQSLEGILFVAWTSRLFLSITQELARFTSIAPLFASFATKVDSFSKTILPGFICYYLNITGKEGSKQVIKLLSEFSKLHSYESDFVEFLIQTLLKIRMGAKKSIPIFMEVYLSLNLDYFYRIAAENNYSKTALMLFEDELSNSEKVIDWLGNSKLLSNIYESIDNDDLIFGLPEETSLEYAINMINRRKESSDQFRFDSGLFDTSISFDLETKNTRVLNSMIRNGFLGVSKLVSKNLDNGDKNNATFEWAWKLNCWDIPSPREANEEHQIIYKTLKQIHDYPSYANEACEESLLQTLYSKDTITNYSSSPKEFRLNIERWLISLTCIYNIRDVLHYKESNFEGLLHEFSKCTNWFEQADFDWSENILLARKSALQILAESSADISSLTKESMWLCSLHDLIRYNSIAIIADELQKLVNSIVMINELSKSKFSESDHLLKDSISQLTKYQIARTLWQQGQTSIPVIMLKELQQNEAINLSISNMHITPSLINANLVEWMSKSRQDLASNIMEKYVLPTADMVTSVKEMDQKAKVYEILANFCETQFRSRGLNDHIYKLEKLVELKKSEIEELKTHYSRMPVAADEKKSAQRYYSKLKAQYIAELSDLNSLKRSISEFSDKAVEFYLKSILTDGDSDENLDKFFALWLEHSNKDELHVTLSDNILSLPNHKLISWSTQLISRLSSESSKFQSLLKSLIVGLCFDHPYHSLYGLISLKKHESYAKKSSNVLLISKSLAANDIWQQLITRGNKKVSEILLNVEKFCDESIKLAEYKVPKGKSIQLGSLKVGDYWLNHLSHIPPPTISLTVDLSTSYDNVIYLERIDPRVTIATSGLSLPKIASFYLSNGSEHKVLLKHGTDDLRQDSIMEQVFEKVNNIFKKDKETRKRELKVRTYKAVPLGPETGIIEFVPNSIALIDSIRPYHMKIDILKADKARDLMKTCQSADKTERYKTYDKISKKISPVLRYFFFDNYVTPDTWFDCRTSYTRGIATTSVVGHILGLGDRHCNNILLDKSSGEPIHIDLGVAFDQGKRLPIPETVPFRLTRDIVDGFGITGVNGVFNKSCEHTYRVLRQNKEHILAILDVLRWDPLYSWSLSPIRRKKLQNEGDRTEMGHLNPQEDGSEGGRAVLMVSDKLTAGGLSVEAIVRELIQEATSPHNLALIYCGWCPFY
ncbi:Serine/threonine-protein kinase TEL1 [Debaryomyces fabryi]|uniref:Serine/threonine-protein kinase Tel1 n=1 Tax=Debaryomyces fabryi TaxID=58627 RepID=A0A0V1PVS6_9ASCO|nr:Serine/threonine-protein kinase TEL1 [Debaryomyces fabryi]KSA00388.1 Serine/threonine-protein kinase TEL1 [Debaryomyces fabryi]CUM52324.1 unnamed protein product [Debaryomyces fabryi]